MSRYRELIEKRLASDDTPLSVIPICWDTERRAEAKAAHDAAKQETARLRVQVATLQAQSGQDAPKRKLNAPNPLTEARKALEAAEAAEEAAKEQLRDCFIKLHFKPLTAVAIQQMAQEGVSAGDASEWNRAVLARVMKKVTNHDGTEVVDDLGPEQIMDHVDRILPISEARKVVDALTAASEGVDFPT